MNAYQLIAVMFALVALALDVWAIVTVARSPIKYKVFWIIGCLFGFVGLGINWTKADDIFLEFGIQIPIIAFRYFVPSHEVAAKIMFPVIAAIALIRSRTAAE